MAFGVTMNQKEKDMNTMTTRAMFRANYADLNSRTGEARANVFADITLPALAPVLRNPLLQVAFLRYLTNEIFALNLHEKQNVDGYAMAIDRLQKLGYYGTPVPVGFAGKIKFYWAFFNAITS